MGVGDAYGRGTRIEWMDRWMDGVDGGKGSWMGLLG